MIFGRPARDYFFAALLWAVAIAYTATALGFPESARSLPLLTGIVLIVLTTVDVLSLTETGIGRRLRLLNPVGKGHREGTADAAHPGTLGQQVRAWAFVVGLVVLIILIGLVGATAIYVAASLHVLGRRKLFTALAIGLLTAIFCYALFELALQIELYRGLLFGAEW